MTDSVGTNRAPITGGRGRYTGVVDSPGRPNDDLPAAGTCRRGFSRRRVSTRINRRRPRRLLLSLAGHGGRAGRTAHAPARPRLRLNGTRLRPGGGVAKRARPLCARPAGAFAALQLLANHRDERVHGPVTVSRPRVVVSRRCLRAIVVTANAATVLSARASSRTHVTRRRP